ncbi:MAG: NAD-dependent deacylase [Candidatus Zixiibacteriota bacterium]
MIKIPSDLEKILESAESVAVLTGAGISAESGVPTFRGQDGLWKKFRAEELATVDAFMRNPELVWEWYLFRRNIINEVKPNPGHYALAKMESYFKEFSLITQNVDGLHNVAGSKKVWELHGNIMRNKCFECSAPYEGEIDIEAGTLPVCRCGGKIRPDVVWFGEMLSEKILNASFSASQRADLFLSVGTSAVVHPAASLPTIAKRNGAYFVEINVEPTPLTDLADCSFLGKSGEILPKIVERLKR